LIDGLVVVYEMFVDISFESGLLVTKVDAININFFSSHSNDLPLRNIPIMCVYCRHFKFILRFFGFGQLDSAIVKLLLLLRPVVGSIFTEHQVVKRLRTEGAKKRDAGIPTVDSTTFKHYPHLFCHIFFIYHAINSVVYFFQRFSLLGHILPRLF